ncbi:MULTISPECIES: fimbrial biogenesis chaperone [Acinetobacter]|jgi:fimbrial chaperone protein|uniref:Molecular chaperone n=2 Tax=Acinetobacter TaxID=469 RepID=A0A4Q7B4S6_9GAMM|nr:MULTISPECIES: fimbria/pilus periplasmic chaperone [Acinetobacter]MCW8038713.1 fimbria/pilus periplasmic chaperone [Acinetobacter entericus]QXW25565.1 fimbria/pilus periplasmic chaperone [Acinetobacter johnsonii]RZG69773.1 molecular chaperone [Acinetobacter bouvetii]
MKKNLLVFMTSLLFAIKAFAGVSVSPVQMFIDNPNKLKSTTLTLESVDETEKRVFEVKVFKWTQTEQGENVLEPDNNIIINPKNFILQPNKKQAIRVGFTPSAAQGLNVAEEQAWRIIIDEITPVGNQMMVKFLVNFNLPLFVGKQDNLKVNFEVKNGHLILNNLANSHVQVTNLKLLDEQRKVIFNNDTMAYVLAKHKIFYDLKNINLTDPKKYSVVLETNNSKKAVEMKLFN